MCKHTWPIKLILNLIVLQTPDPRPIWVQFKMLSFLVVDVSLRDVNQLKYLIAINHTTNHHHHMMKK